MNGFVTYEAFGAAGDGVRNDQEAICKAHEHANEHHLAVRAKRGAVYYIGGEDMTAVIRTDTDWTGARFIIDDRQVQNRNAHVFRIESDYPSFPLELQSLSRDQKSLPMTFDRPVFVRVKSDARRIYIRRGLNQNSGVPLQDCFRADKDGTILNDIIWDFDTVTSAVAQPMDETTLTVKGGTFTTIANPGVLDEETGAMTSKYHYYSRGISCRRSHTDISGITYLVEGEGDEGAPYGGFISVESCAEVHVHDCVLTGHKIYQTIGSAGLPVSMGTYALGINTAANIRFTAITQTTDIMDRRYWGLMGSNFCKDLEFENCNMSRFDAHMGVTNCTIRDCVLGWQFLNAIGFGTFIIENTEAFGSSLVNLRSDYGSFWTGTMKIRNCIWHPAHANGSIIGGANDSTHDFGYVCTMPAAIEIDGLKILDGAYANDPDYKGVYILPDYAAENGNGKPFPYVPTTELSLHNITTESGRPVADFRTAALYPTLRIQRS